MNLLNDESEYLFDIMEFSGKVALVTG